jgi:hypothetical protein
MQGLVLLVLLVAAASAAYTRYGHSTYHGVSPYLHSTRTYHGYPRYHGYPSVYSHGLYRYRRDAEAEPEAAPEAAPEAEAEAEPGTALYYNTLPYNTVPYVTPHHVPYYTVNPAAVKVKTTAAVPTVYNYNPYYLPYGGAYGHYNPYSYNPYHPQYVLKPVEKEADEPTAATSEDDSEVVEVRKRREAEAEPEADPATKVVTHHVPAVPYPYTHLSPYHVVPKVATKVVKTYSHYPTTYTTYPYYNRYPAYGYPAYNGYIHG